MVGLKVATLEGADALLSEVAVKGLRSALRGQLLQLGDEGYDESRKVWNAAIDNRPALIARCTSTQDIVASVNFAREHDLLVSVRGGGHNYAGKAVCNGGLMIDLSPMKGIRVDPVKKTAWAQAGLNLGEFDCETQKFGLATTLGVNTDTGIAGLTLGGGYGWLAGKFGLACDNLISAEVVTADGRVLRANVEQNIDLFWGLRGAGANFGIVTSFEYQLHQVGPVLGGLVIFPLTRDVLSFYDQFSSNAPDELITAGAVLTTPEGTPGFGIIVCYSGSLDKGEKVLEPLRTFSTPIADLVEPKAYVDMQTVLDEAWPPGRLYYNKAHNLSTIQEGAIDVILEYARTIPTDLSNIAFQQLHGAASRIPADETAFPHRYDHYVFLAHPSTEDPADYERMVNWSKKCWDAMQPFADQAVYVNALEDGLEEGEIRVRQAYEPNYDRLVALKNKYDPTNLFRLNANIKPSV